MINSTILRECLHEAANDLDEILNPEEDYVDETLGQFMPQRVIDELASRPDILAELSTIRQSMVLHERKVRALQRYFDGTSDATTFLETVRNCHTAE